jgi:stress response protein SCP2
MHRRTNERDQALNSDDLATCDLVLKAVKAEFSLSDGCDEVARSASIIIELYRQGVHDPEQLKALVFAARGKLD